MIGFPIDSQLGRILNDIYKRLRALEPRSTPGQLTSKGPLGSSQTPTAQGATNNTPKQSRIAYWA